MPEVTTQVDPDDSPEKFKQERRIDKTCLSYWFPLLQAAGLPVPRTIMVSMSHEAFRDVFRVFDGEDMRGDAEPFFQELKKAADEIGYPCFLRTGQTSAKHSWDRSCFLPSADAIKSHVVEIIEYSECVDIRGLDCTVWAAREILPTKPLGVCPDFFNMPLCRECRFFVKEGEVRCWHPYWIKEAIEQGGADVALYDALASTEAYEQAFTLAHKAARAINGAWSIDVLDTERGWYITDMAEAHKSFHQEGCEYAAEFEAQQKVNA